MASAIAVLAMGTGIATAAAQTTYNISGQTNTGGSVVTYGTYRSHVSGPITLQITAGVTNGAQYNMISQSSGNTVGWTGTLNAGGQASWASVLTGSYAMQAQQNSSSVLQKTVTGCNNTWSANFTM